MSFKQNIIHKLNKKQEMFVLSRLLYPSLCVWHSYIMSVYRCLNVGCGSGNTLYKRTHTHRHTRAERAVLLLSNVYLLEHFRAGILLSVNWQLGSILEGKAHWTAASFPDWLIGKDRKGRKKKYPNDLGCYCTRMTFYSSRSTFIMTKCISNNPSNL